MRQNSNKINYIFNTGYQIISVLTPMITAPYVSRVLGAEGLGQYAYSYSIVTYFVLLATLGTTAYGQREIAYAKSSIEARSKVFWKVFLFRCMTTLIMLVFYSCFVMLIPIKCNTIVLYIQAIYILNVALDTAWYFQGVAEFVPLTIRNTFVRIISIIMIFLFVKSTDDVDLYCLILVASTSVGLIVTLPLLKNQLCRVHLQFKEILCVLKDCFPLFIPTVAVQVYTVLDKTMIGLYTISNVENGYYDQAEKIVKMTVVLVTSLSTVLAPKIATAYKSDNKNEVQEYMKTLVKYVFMMGIPISIGLFSISDYFIPFFLGKGYDKCIVLMKIFSPIVFVLGLSNVFGTTFLVQTSKQKMVNNSVIWGAIINLLLNLLLIPRFYSIGAAIASIIAESAVTLIQLFYVRKYLPIREIFSGINIYVISSGIMGCLIVIIGKCLLSLSCGNSLIVVLQIAVGIISYLLLLVINRDTMILSIINSLFNNKIFEK